MSGVPTFNRGFRLRHDPVRASWVVLGPERLFQLDDHAAEVLQLVDGRRTTDEIVAALAAKFAAPAEEIGTDVRAMLHDLSQRGVLTVT